MLRTDELLLLINYDRYGSKARRVDLSYNELITLKNIELFRECEELILDNNSLGDDTVFPALPKLTILTLNKNRISDTEGFLTQVKQVSQSQMSDVVQWTRCFTYVSTLVFIRCLPLAYKICLL